MPADRTLRDARGTRTAVRVGEVRSILMEGVLARWGWLSLAATALCVVVAATLLRRLPPRVGEPEPRCDPWAGCGGMTEQVDVWPAGNTGLGELELAAQMFDACRNFELVATGVAGGRRARAASVCDRRLWRLEPGEPHHYFLDLGAPDVTRGVPCAG